MHTNTTKRNQMQQRLALAKSTQGGATHRRERGSGWRWKIKLVSDPKRERGKRGLVELGNGEGSG